MNKQATQKLRNYRRIKADIVDINIRLEELDEDIDISAIDYSIDRVQSSPSSSSTEAKGLSLIEKKEELLKKKTYLERELLKIDNALTLLNDEERDIITVYHIQGKPIYKLQLKYHKSYSRIKTLEKKAISKIEKYLINIEVFIISKDDYREVIRTIEAKCPREVFKELKDNFEFCGQSCVECWKTALEEDIKIK